MKYGRASKLKFSVGLLKKIGGEAKKKLNGF